ncbi:hypothetical protein [Falsirhodobacter sp. 20TX0035]|uniref:hypothetical protein n=1 Tax=Falsirhodobacter sp. 20TX0035 TaxID=3022019 RepID=UPI00232FACFC|nr:hypothetical protein [Falsirhodobacter sp. 20TX0035]MDB6454519.1 hypothetical protein [Falsirhodobacter sp. 20TX0035]
MTRPFARPAETAPSTAYEIVFDHYDPADERRRESLLSLGNGVLHARASAPEEARGEAHYPGLYRAGCYARLGGQVEGTEVSVDSLANLPNWLHLAFRLEGEAGWLSFDRVEILRYRQRLDMAKALLSREVLFRDGQGRTTHFTEERFLSMAHPHLGALSVCLQPKDWSGRIEWRSGVHDRVDNELAVTEGGYDPQALDRVHSEDAGDGCILTRTRTRGTGVDVAIAARTRVVLDGRKVEGAVSVAEGGLLRVEKVGVVHTARDHAVGDLPQAVLGAVRDAQGYVDLRKDHVMAWHQLWARCRVEVGDPNLARAAALHAFHLLQTASPHASLSDAGLPSRGWQEAYHGQIFWDETLSLSFLSLHIPEVVRSALIHRHRRLGTARRRAAEQGLAGALYPWRSATTGIEETPEFQENPKSGRWHRDDTRFQFHVGSAIALNVWRYFLATRDVDFMAGYGAEMMVEIARMWASLAQPHPDHPGRLSLRGVVGPDEFHIRYPGADRPGVDDDTYTNIMAAWTLIHAGQALDRLPALRRKGLMERLELTGDDIGEWPGLAARLHLARDSEGRFLPFDRYETLEPFDLEAHERDHPGERLDWFIEAQHRDINALQVQKQASFAMLVHLLPVDELLALLDHMGHPATQDDLRRTVEADLARTSHDSSLSDLIYAGALARLAPERSWDMFGEALHPDEKEGHSGTEKGVHLGAMAATLDILQRVHLGVRPSADALVIDPSPHPHHGRLCAHVLFRTDAASIELDAGRLCVRAEPGNGGDLPLRILGVSHRLPPGRDYVVHLHEEKDHATDQSAAVRP